MSLLCHPKSNGTTVGRLGGVQDQILLPRASAHKSVLLGTPDGVVEWGRKVIEVREMADAAQIVFADGVIETCDLRPQAQVSLTLSVRMGPRVYADRFLWQRGVPASIRVRIYLIF